MINFAKVSPPTAALQFAHCQPSGDDEICANIIQFLVLPRVRCARHTDACNTLCARARVLRVRFKSTDKCVINRQYGNFCQFRSQHCESWTVSAVRFPCLFRQLSVLILANKPLQSHAIGDSAA